MNEHDDPQLSELIGAAAGRYQAAPDLRSRIDRRAGQQRRRAHVAMAMAVLLVVAVAVSSLAYRSRQGGELRSGVATAVTPGPDAPGSTIASIPPNTASTATTANPTPAHPVEWNTQTVELRADDLRIEVGGKVFVGADPRVSLNSDPGIPNEYTTFEATWREHDVEMRMNIYFTSDGQDWWANEIRTYDGNPRGEWITYTGEFFRNSLTVPFVGDLHLPDDATSHDRPGTLALTGLRLQAFLTPTVCNAAEPGLKVEVLYPQVIMSTQFDTNFGARIRLRDEACAVITDLTPYSVTWQVDDPTVIAVTPACAAGTTGIGCLDAELKLLRDGETTVRATVQDASGATVAESSMVVASGTVAAQPQPSTPTP